MNRQAIASSALNLTPALSSCNRLWLVFACLIALVGGVGVTGLRQMQSAHAGIERIGKDQFATLKLARQGLQLSALNNRLTMQVFLMEDREQISRLLQERAENSETISRLLDQLIVRVPEAREQALLNEVIAARKPYVTSYQHALRILLDEHDAKTASAAMVQTTIPNLIQYHDAWERFAQDQMDQTDQLVQESRKRYAVARREVLMLVGAAVVCAVFIAIFATKKIASEVATRTSAEEALRKSHQELEWRVADRTVQLSAAVCALETEIVERQRLEREILDISEREQCRLGQDLHDGLGQQLTGISLLSKVLATTLKAEAHPLAKAANDIAIYTAETISVARGLAKGLYPVELNRGGLLLALEDLAARTSRQFRIDCKVIQSGPEPHIEKSAEIHIYRIVQESISNAIRHGHAQCIVIETRATAGLHVFSVTDNGQGFEKSSAVSSGMGLHLMDYRARLIHAQLQVKTVGRGGCQVTCILKADEQPLQGSPVLGKPEVLAGV